MLQVADFLILLVLQWFYHFLLHHPEAVQIDDVMQLFIFHCFYHYYLMFQADTFLSFSVLGLPISQGDLQGPRRTLQGHAEDPQCSTKDLPGNPRTSRGHPKLVILWNPMSILPIVIRWYQQYFLFGVSCLGHLIYCNILHYVLSLCYTQDSVCVMCGI